MGAWGDLWDTAQAWGSDAMAWLKSPGSAIPTAATISALPVVGPLYWGAVGDANIIRKIRGKAPRLPAASQVLRRGAQIGGAAAVAGGVVLAGSAISSAGSAIAGGAVAGAPPVITAAGRVSKWRMLGDAVTRARVPGYTRRRRRSSTVGTIGGRVVSDIVRSRVRGALRPAKKAPRAARKSPPGWSAADRRAQAAEDRHEDRALARAQRRGLKSTRRAAPPSRKQLAARKRFAAMARARARR